MLQVKVNADACVLKLPMYWARERQKRFENIIIALAPGLCLQPCWEKSLPPPPFPWSQSFLNCQPSTCPVPSCPGSYTCIQSFGNNRSSRRAIGKTLKWGGCCRGANRFRSQPNKAAASKTWGWKDHGATFTFPWHSQSNETLELSISLSLLHLQPPSQQLCLSLLPMQVKNVEPYSHHPVTMRDQQQHWPETGRSFLVVKSCSQDTMFQDLGTKGPWSHLEWSC